MKKSAFVMLLLTTACGSEEQSVQRWPIPIKKPAPTPLPVPVPTATPMPIPIPVPPFPTPVPTPAPMPPPPEAPAPPPENPAPPEKPLDGWAILHNQKRTCHGVPPLTWSKTLAASAQAWVNGCVFQHDPANRFGENLAIGTSLSQERAFSMWYEEGNGYPYGVATPPMSLMHFTQIVWKGTLEVGCASAVCRQGVFHACRYSPPGNVIGRFAENVPPPVPGCGEQTGH